VSLSLRAALVAAVLLGALPAGAEPARAEEPAAPAVAPDMLVARRHFMAATEALKAGEPARAASEFAAAHRITKDPLLLFNVAEAHRKAGNPKAALKAYRGYLAGTPAAPDREEVEKTIKALEAELKPQHATAAATAAAKAAPAEASAAPAVAPEATGLRPGPAPAEPEQSRLRLAAWITASAAVAFAATGGLMTLKQQNVKTDLSHKMRAVDPQTGQPLPYASVEPEIRDLRSQARRYETLAVVFYATAAAAGIAAGTMFYVDHKRRGSERRARVRLAPHIAAREVGLVAGVEF
jgi:hypothetical protein